MCYCFGLHSFWGPVDSKLSEEAEDNVYGLLPHERGICQVRQLSQ